MFRLLQDVADMVHRLYFPAPLEERSPSINPKGNDGGKDGDGDGGDGVHLLLVERTLLVDGRVAVVDRDIHERLALEEHRIRDRDRLLVRLLHFW